MDPGWHYSRALLSTGRTYHYVDQRPKDSENATTLFCLHGFPDLSYGWRHQIPPWVAAGYRVVAPDMLGYGKTDMPSEVPAYASKRICDDLAALLDHLGVQKAVVIGHDWGSVIAGRFALWHPERLLALAMLSQPYTPPSPHNRSARERAQLYPPYGYQIYFESEESTAEIDANLSLFFRIIYRKPSDRLQFSWSNEGQLQQFLLSGNGPDECMLDDKELEYYLSNFQRGMIGPLSYYRAIKYLSEDEKKAALPSNLRSDLPALLLYGADDLTCPPMAVQNASKYIDRLQVVSMPGVRHWIMLEAPQVVTDTILQWLESAALGPRASVRL